MASFPPLKFTRSGHIFIGPRDNPQAIASILDLITYQEEYCLALNFSAPFIARLMAAGFLVMSLIPEDKPGGAAILLPEMHLKRSVLFFDQLHESRSARRLIPRYELKTDGFAGTGPCGPAFFEEVLERCAQVHGEGWLTPALRRSFHALYTSGVQTLHAGNLPLGPQMVSFGLFREERLVAGEFGVAAGKVYTSYSGYKEEDSAGTVQLILAGRWLRDSGFAFWDLGMLLPYKKRLGAQALDRREFLERFRAAQEDNQAGLPEGIPWD
ncbi:MAG: leucyl-tRNA--protein transferase [Treponema sp.]|jgi:Leu/Phe-tRNA-protein transferase|nr:leucyl-tRNA--protein transferase [Treponema sp.]